MEKIVLNVWNYERKRNAQNIIQQINSNKESIKVQMHASKYMEDFPEQFP